MELFLNFVWLAVASALVLCSVRWMRRAGRRMDWTIAIALVLLVLVLLPVISMTDDLVAISTPSESEHLLSGLNQVSSFVTLSCLVSVISTIQLVTSLPAIEETRLRPRTFAAAALEGFVRAVGVRPPTAGIRSLRAAA